MPKLEALRQKQTEMFEGIDYGVLKKIIGEGITSFGSLVLEYNRRIRAGREKIDAFNNITAQEIADFLRSEGKEEEAKAIEKLLKKENIAGKLHLLKEKPVSSFTTFIEKSQPKEK